MHSRSLGGALLVAKRNCWLLLLLNHRHGKMERKAQNMAQTVEQATRQDLLILREYASTRNPALFSELAARYTNSVFATCLRITSNAHDAEDLTQDCFFELARQAHSIKSSVGGWLHRMATNRALNALRSRQRRHGHEKGAGGVHETPKSDGASWSDVAPILDEAIDSLPDELREAIVQHYLEGQSQSEIANRLNLNQSTMSRRVKQGLELLRQRLKSRGLTLSLATMTTLLMDNAAEAASSQLVSSVAKIGLAGVGPKLMSFTSVKVTTWCKVCASFAMPVVVQFFVGGWLTFVTGAGMVLYLSWFKPAWFLELLEAFGNSPVTFSNYNLLDRWNWKSPPANARHVMFVSLVVAAFAFCFAAIFLFTSDFSNRFGMSALMGLIGVWRLAIAIKIGWHIRNAKVATSSSTTEPHRLSLVDVAQSALLAASMTLLLAWCLMMKQGTTIGFFGWYAMMLGMGVVWGLAETAYKWLIYRDQPATSYFPQQADQNVTRAAWRGLKVLLGFAGFMLATSALIAVLTLIQPGSTNDALPFLGIAGCLSFGSLTAALQPLHKLWQTHSAQRPLWTVVAVTGGGCLILNAYWLFVAWTGVLR